MSPYLNRRTDEYGGTPEKRARFVLEVMEAVIAHYPAGRAGIRISPFTDFNGAIDPDPVPTYSYLIRELNTRGLGWLEVADTSFWWGKFERTRMVELARPLFSGPIVANGGIDPATAQEIIGNGTVDAVSFGRLWLANPDLPERIRQGGPYTKSITKRFYGGGPDGYNDYPTLAQQPPQ
jgi:2,4-dienoyl-CoA reductase-like NADH-dependent reductase (Old Yellow Enzyme family)